MNTSKLPASVIAAIIGSNFHFVTKRNELIPLALITAVTLVGESNDPTFDISKWDGNRDTYYAHLPKGSLAVAVAGSEEGVHDGIVIVEPDEIPAFTTALDKLR
jgi:hypothetical protein